MRGYPKRYIVFDTESHSTPVPGPQPTVRLTLRLGAAVVIDPDHGLAKEDVVHWFQTPDEFHDLVMSLPLDNEPIYVFAHNIGFDVRQVSWFRWVSEGAYSLTPPTETVGAMRFGKPLFVAESPPFIVRLFRKDGQQLILLDTFQWFGVSLAKIGKWIGNDKLEMPDWAAPDEDWFEYCKQDVRVLHEALRKLWSYLKSHRVPDWAETPASLVMRLYRMRHEKKRIIRPLDMKPLELDRLGYYGGLSEAFTIGPLKGPIYQVDVTSMYPYLMRRELYPCEVIDHGDFAGGGFDRESFDVRGVTADVCLESPCHPWPVRGSDQTLHVTGRIRTVLCGPELERAWSMGLVRTVNRWTRYRLCDLFTAFVDYWWRARCDAKRNRFPLAESICKVLMNGLHGKFGQRTGAWESVGKSHPKGLYAQGRYVGMQPHQDKDIRILDGMEWVRTRDEEDPRGFVPIAAWTSSYARCFIWDMIYYAGIDHVHYVATDSLLVDGEGLGALQTAGLVEEGVLGLFRVEGVYERCHVHGQNAVDLDARKKRSGVKTGSREIRPDIWSVARWSGFADDIFAGNPSCAFIKTVLMDTSKHSLRREVGEDGTTRPWSVNNWHVTPERQSEMAICVRGQGENP